MMGMILGGKINNQTTGRAKAPGEGEGLSSSK